MTAAQQADFAWVDRDGLCLRLQGPWQLSQLGPLWSRLQGRSGVDRVDGSALAGLDTAGAMAVLELLASPDELPELSGFREADRALLELVQQRSQAATPTRKRRTFGVLPLLARVGAAVERAWLQGRTLLGFIGLVLETCAQLFTGRRRLRLTSAVHHMEQAGLDAVPIVCLLSFLVGAVVAYLGATVLADFGAQVFTVELVNFSFLREFGVLLTAILVAGRSGSAFTAEIGAMKSGQEIDAIRTLGMDPIELLVLPRMLALLLMLPVLSFLAMLSGMLGGGLVGILELDISPGLYLTRMQETTELRHLWVGLIKAPVFAFLIAVVGCLEGLKVAGSAASVGTHTTSSVVQTIFLVILVDALFAIFFMKVGL
ncbi:MAG: ABC transporter permease [Xanthomonadales bacterium]|nr:ABC transporter permease [Xanthomonadales bacterium]